MSDETKFSQESLTLLLTGGNTGVDISHHLPITSSYGDTPDFETESRVPGHEQIMTAAPFTSEYVTALQIEVDENPVEIKSTYIPMTKLQSIRLDQDPGVYEFKLDFETKDVYPKNYPHCYSRDKNMLIARDNTPIPITFHSQYDMRSLFVRIMPVYSSPDSFSVPVKPCYNHGSSQGVEHEFISAVNSAATNEHHGDRHSLRLPLMQCRDISSEQGTMFVENIIFHCRSSCSTKEIERGINNRALALIFTLESSDGSVVSRFVLSLKVSVSPGRDIATLEKHKPACNRRSMSNRKRASSDVVSNRPAKRTCSYVAGAGKYHLTIKGKEAHKMLQKIAIALDRSAQGNHTKPWAEYMTGMTASQSSVASQENGSQPDHYSLEGWLARYGLERYTVQLEEAGLGEPSTFQQLSDKDLDTMGIVDKCHRLTLHHAAQRILLKEVSLVLEAEIRA